MYRNSSAPVLQCLGVGVAPPCLLMEMMLGGLAEPSLCKAAVIARSPDFQSVLLLGHLTSAWCGLGRFSP